jgi:glycosyltransferase involved in cell wall biosynthesis
MACGTPVVAYDRGAAGEVVVHGQTGFIARTFSELLAGIEAAADLDPDCCRRHVAENFSANGMVEAYASLYQSVVQERHIDIL